jgi:flavin reductase (DIM6/NTAB) family NADH-FMN oxidoreductase RutF
MTAQSGPTILGLDPCATGGHRDIDEDRFRSIMGSFPSGIGVVTSLAPDGAPHGMTCSALCSVSADPPLLAVCLAVGGRTVEAITARPQFAVNFLDSDARPIAQRFAGREPDKFTGVAWRAGAVTGAPLLDATVAVAECTVHRMDAVGDHLMVVGRVVGGDTDGARAPLAYWRRRYRRLAR